MTAPKVGDVVAWADVPDGAMVRTCDDWCAVNIGGAGTWVSNGRLWFAPLRHGWQWVLNGRGRATIIALGLTGQETAADLQRLAEVFEAWEFILSHGDTRGWERAWGVPVDSLAERLHAAGWRPGMTAEDAARLLAGAGK